MRFGRRYTLLQQDDRAGVFVGSIPLHLFDVHDRAQVAYVMAALDAAGGASKIEIAGAFGVHRNTVTRVRDRLDQGGMAALVRVKPGPKGPHKVTEAVRQMVIKNVELSSTEVAQKIFQELGVKLTSSRVRQLRRNAAAHQLELLPAAEPVVAAAAEAAEVVDEGNSPLEVEDHLPEAPLA
ncbi:transposase, partial [mine drainage metagenome]